MTRALIATTACALLAACSSSPPQQTAEAPPPAYTVTQTATHTEYAVPDLLLFATDSSEVLPGGHKVIADIVAAARAKGDVPVEVAGYADTTGSAAHNQRLSEARAGAVASEMAQNGIAPGRIQARGFGETGLAVATGDNEDEARNRRVVIRIASR